MMVVSRVNLDRCLATLPVSDSGLAKANPGGWGTGRFPSGPDHSEDGAGEKIQGDVLFGGQRGIHDAGAPAHVQNPEDGVIADPPDEPIQPDGREDGKSHVK